MKLMHLSDLHLGKRLIDVSLLEDQQFILDQITQIAAEEHPQVVLISGDVYDRSNPPAEAMTLFARFLSQLTAQGCTVLVISGNHDSSERVAYLGELVRENGVYLSPVYHGHIDPVSLKDEFGEVRFYLMPYVHPAVVCQYFPDEEMRTLSHCFICGHVHDELIIEASTGVDLKAVCEQMGRVPPWLPGAMLRADGYETEWYQEPVKKSL